MDRAIGHHPHTLEQVLDRHRYATALAHVHGHASHECQVQIGCCHPERARAVDGQQDVRQDGHRALALRYAQHARHELQQITLGYREFHDASLTLLNAWLGEICSGVDRACGLRGEPEKPWRSVLLPITCRVGCQGERPCPARGQGAARPVTPVPSRPATQPCRHVVLIRWCPERSALRTRCAWGGLRYPTARDPPSFCERPSLDIHHLFITRTGTLSPRKAASYVYEGHVVRARQARCHHGEDGPLVHDPPRVAAATGSMISTKDDPTARDPPSFCRHTSDLPSTSITSSSCVRAPCRLGKPPLTCTKGASYGHDKRDVTMRKMGLSCTIRHG